MSPQETRDSLIDLEETFLPIGEMRQIRRVTEVSGSTIRGEVDVGPGHWAYRGHFPDDPIFPGALIVEAAGQLVALWAWAQGQRGRPRLVRTRAEFRHPVEPGCGRIELRAEVRGRRNLSFADVVVSAGDLEVAGVEAVLAVLPAG